MIKRFIASAVIFVAGFAFSSAMNGKSLGSFAKGLLARPDSNTITTQGSLRPSTQQWEYRVMTKIIHNVGGYEDYGLGALGSQGFEVVGVSQSTVAPPNSGYYLTIVLRRPKQ